MDLRREPAEHATSPTEAGSGARAEVAADDEPTAAEVAAETLSPIPGKRLDEPPRHKPGLVERLERRSPWATVVWQAIQRFRLARGPVLAGGTAYYAFLAMFSLLAFAYGVAALVSADELAQWLTEALEQSLPGLVGEEGIDPATLERVGRTASIAGLAVLLYSGSAVMVAISDSLHTLYGAPPDGRGLVVRRAHLLGWLAVVGPLIAVSAVSAGVIAGFGTEILDDLGFTSDPARWLAGAVSLAATVALDVGIAALVLSRLGGIRPARRPLLTGAVVGGLTATVLKAAMAAIVAWSVRKPQYGSFAVPIAALVVLWFQALGLYAAAALTAATAEVAPVRRRDRRQREA